MTTQTRETVTLTRATAPGRGAAQDLPPGGRKLGRRRKFTEHSPAGEVLLAYLDAQAARLSALDLEVRRDKPDAVHQMRVTVRRLRSTLQAFTALMPSAGTRQLRTELKWLGGVLGAARDVEVLTDQLQAGLAALPTELVLGPAQARVSVHFAGQEADTRRAVLEVLDSERYRALRTGLAGLLDSPPLTPEAAEPAGKVLPRAVGRAYRRTDRRMRRVRQAPAGQAHDVALHETRKAAKRARYAAELAEPALGKKAGKKAHRFARRMKDVQSALGSHQDAVIVRATARDIGVQAHLAGENAFSFGLLRERAHHQALACQRQAHRAWRQAKRKSHGFPPKP
jgi:CHAD domain-containing protein